MDVRVGRHGAGGAAKVIDGFVEHALFLEDTTKVVARDAVHGVELDGCLKCGARLFGLARLVERDSEIDMSLNPFRGELEDLPVGVNGLWERLGGFLAIERCLEQFFRRAARQRVQLRRFCGHAEGENPLLPDGIEWPSFAGRNYQNFAPLFKESKLLKGHGGAAKLLLN